MENLKELSKNEMRLIEGGDTTFAYDVGITPNVVKYLMVLVLQLQVSGSQQ